MGCAAAREIARRAAAKGSPADVVVLERAVPGAEASSAAAGILGAQIEMRETGPLLDMLVRAREGYRAFTEELRAETGLDCGWRASGVLVVEEVARLEQLVKAQASAGLRAEMVDASRARAIEPELSPAVHAAAWLPDDAQVDPPALLRALVASLPKHGVRVQSGVTVDRLLVDRGRCTGARVDDHGERRDVAADAVVLAAGSWSSLVRGLEGDLALPEVKPARGQIVLLEERPPRLRTIVSGGEAYAVPRGDGRVVCGSTLEFVGFRREVTAGGVRAILDGTLAMVPSLAAAQLATTWSAFRPFTAGDLPLVGASKLPGLFLATGHHRNGILLAQLTAERVADAVARA